MRLTVHKETLTILAIIITRVYEACAGAPRLFSRISCEYHFLRILVSKT